MADISFVTRIKNALATATTWVLGGNTTVNGTLTVNTSSKATISDQVGTPANQAIYLNKATPSASNWSLLASANETYIAASSSVRVTTNGTDRWVFSTSSSYTTTNHSVGVGTNAAPVASAGLEVISTTKGFLMPRMTRAQRVAIASPANYLMVSQTDNDAGSGELGGLWIYNPLKSGGAGWDRASFQAESNTRGYTAKSANYTAGASDSFIDCTGTIQITLPTSVGIAGREYSIKNSGTGVITVATTSSQTIDGSTTKVLNVQYACVTVVADGANWKIKL